MTRLFTTSIADGASSIERIKKYHQEHQSLDTMIHDIFVRVLGVPNNAVVPIDQNNDTTNDELTSSHSTNGHQNVHHPQQQQHFLMEQKGTRAKELLMDMKNMIPDRVVESIFITILFFQEQQQTNKAEDNNHNDFTLLGTPSLNQTIDSSNIDKKTKEAETALLTLKDFLTSSKVEKDLKYKLIQFVSFVLDNSSTESDHDDDNTTEDLLNVLECSSRSDKSLSKLNLTEQSKQFWTNIYAFNMTKKENVKTSSPSHLTSTTANDQHNTKTSINMIPSLEMLTSLSSHSSFTELGCDTFREDFDEENSDDDNNNTQKGTSYLIPSHDMVKSISSHYLPFVNTMAKCTNSTETISQGGEYAADQIYNGAKAFQNSLSTYITPNVTSTIEAAGSFMKESVDPCTSSSEDNEKDDEGQQQQKNQKKLEIIDDDSSVLKVANASLRATDIVRQGAQTLTFGVRDLSTTNINRAADKWEENEIGKTIIPEDEYRSIAAAAGKVGVATLGAAAIVTESIFEATKTVAQTSVHVAADVTSYRYGENAGKLVKNTGDTAGNLVRTMTHVAAMEAQILTGIIAKNSAKVHLDQKHAGRTEDMMSSSTTT